eukprot:46431_1
MTTLLTTKGCPFAERINLLIKWSNIKHIKIKNVSLQKKPAYLKTISPYNRVPVLVFDNDTLSDGKQKCIWESAAIFQYLDDINPPKIMRGTPYEQAMQRIFTHYCNTQFSKALYLYLFDDTKDEWENVCGYLKEHSELINGYIDPMMIDFSYAPFLQRIRLLQEVKAYQPNDFIYDWMKRCDSFFDKYYTLTTEELIQLYQPYFNGKKKPFSQTWQWN